MSLKGNERLKLFGGVLENGAKRQVVAVSVGEDRISPRAIAVFCNNEIHLANSYI